MQASKIQINSEYAYRAPGRLIGFRVIAIKTLRTAQGASSTIVGQVVSELRVTDGDVTAVEPVGREINVDPRDITGLFAEEEALVRQREHARALQQEADEQRNKKRNDLARALYRLVGKEVPRKLDDYHNDIRTGYNSVEIKDSLVEALLAAVKSKAKLEA